MALARAFAAWVFTALFCMALALLQLVTFKKLPKGVPQRLVRWWGRNVLKMIGVRLELLNESTLETRASRVFVSNHQSALDVVWVAAVCPLAPLAIGKKEIAWIPFINFGWWAMDYMYIDRKNGRKALATMKRAAREVSENQRTMIILPEGTRTPDGSIQPFKRGAFKFAVETQAVICPVVVSGAFEVLPKTRFLAVPGTIRLRFLPPVETRGLKPADVDGLTWRVEESIRAAYDAQRQTAGETSDKGCLLSERNA